MRAYKTEICFDPGIWIFLALMLMLIPAAWVISWVFAVLLHESFHCVALYLLGYSIYEIRFSYDGARILSGPVSAWHGVICTLAGPALSLLLLLFSAVLPRVSLCVLVLSAFNLLPVYPLDGGRILRYFLVAVTDEMTAERISGIITRVLILVIAILSLGAFAWRKLGIVPLFIPLFLFLKTGKLKIPCKRTLHRVQ